jgi:iron-sulfur cluster assembly accessory protein
MAALWRQAASAASGHRAFAKRRDLPESLVSAGHPPYLGGMSDIALSPSAASRVAAIAARQDKPAILRLSVDGGGCAGFQYRFELAEAVAADDAIAEEEGVTLVVDPVSLDLVRGSTVDFVESLGGAAFQVTNPNAASGCGCGTSFSV